MKIKNNDLRALNVQELQLKADELKRELLKLRLNAATTHVKAFSSVKQQLRKDIARLLTVLHEKHQGRGDISKTLEETAS